MKEKLIIPVSGWLHSEGASDSFLLRTKDGKRCCLGIYLQDNYGISPAHLQGRSSPSQLPEAIKENLPAWLFCSSTDSDLVERLMVANDTPTIPSERGVRLAIASFFAEVGVAVEFTESQPPENAP